jgi:hypothetical protein
MMTAKHFSLTLPKKSMMTVWFDQFSLFTMVVLMSGLLFLSDDHRFGFPFIREILAALSIVAFLYLLIFENHELATADFYLVILALATFIVPPAFAYFYFQQPFYLGMVEERRTLGYFFYFLALFVIGGRTYKQTEVETILFWIFIVGLLWSIACAYGFIPKNQAQSFSVNQEQFQEGFVSEDTRFETRFLNGYFVIFLYPLFLITKNQLTKALLFFVPVALYLFFINQTRSISAILVVTIITLLLIRTKKATLITKLMSIVPLLFFIGYLLVYCYASIKGKPVAFYDNYRNLEFGVMFRDVLKDYFLPHGNLSLHFGDRGFREHFGIGINVYTSDIGFAGSLYKYGIFYPFLLTITILLSIKLYRRYDNAITLILFAYLIGTCALLPFDDHLASFANDMAIMLLLAKVMRKSPTHKYRMAIRKPDK